MGSKMLVEATASLYDGCLITIVDAVEIRLVGAEMSLVMSGFWKLWPAVSRLVWTEPTVSPLTCGVGRIWTVPVGTALVITVTVVAEIIL